MILRDFLYVSALSSIVSLSGCGSMLPTLQNPEKRAQLEGVYEGQIDGITVRYIVKKEMCISTYLEIKPFPGGQTTRQMVIKDLDCDNKVDFAPDEYGFVRNREYLTRVFWTPAFDEFLERSQKLVKPENKIE